MSRFLESIACQNGEFPLLEFHQQRVNSTFVCFYPGVAPLNLEELLSEIPLSGKFKCRVLYDNLGAQVEFGEYQPRKIETIKLVESDIDYSFKFADRSELNSLVQQSGTDEIILVKNGLITDSSYSNLAFFDGDKWWTPKSPLLKGVRRESLLQVGILSEMDISIHHMSSFEKVSLINAMLDLGELCLPISQIVSENS